MKNRKTNLRKNDRLTPRVPRRESDGRTLERRTMDYPTYRIEHEGHRYVFVLYDTTGETLRAFLRRVFELGGSTYYDAAYAWAGLVSKVTVIE